jgi:glycosyltransferase involved in cell wall biosynthesis
MTRPIQISVIIPAYNVETYLAETLDSVLAQTYSHFDVVIVDDGSTDRTLDIARHYAKNDTRIQVISQPNQGVAVARNRGIQETTGELIAFLDADDRWLPRKLETHLSHFAKRPNLGMSFATVSFITSEGQPTGQHSHSKLTQLQPQDFYLENHAITPSNVVIRRSTIQTVGFFNSQINGVADQELFINIISHGVQVEGLDTVLTEYRILTNSISANVEKMELEWQTLNQIVAAYAPKLVRDYSDRSHAYFLRYMARRGIRMQDNPTQVRTLIWRAIQKDWKLLFLEPKRTLSTLIFAYIPVFFVDP